MNDLESPSDTFWPLWQAHAKRLFSICLREMNRNWADAEDALSETMLRALARMPADVDCAEAWLTRVAVNLCRDIKRKHARSAATALLYAATYKAPSDFSSHGETNHESDPAVLIQSLPQELRDVFELRLTNATPYSEIAALFGLSSAGAARKRVQRSRKALRALRDSAGVWQRPDLATRIPPATFHRIVTVDLPCGGLAEVALELDRPPARERQKIATLRAYVARHPAGWTARLKLADLLFFTGRWAEAAECYEAVLKKRTVLPGVMVRLATIARVFHSASNS
jgi:RNA polymerase sigma-70 factor (ECF subfamily)